MKLSITVSLVPSALNRGGNLSHVSMSKHVCQNMNKLKNGWFSEISSLWPGQCFSLEVESILHHEKSPYQDILLFKSKAYGRVLVLDGIIQCTERDEYGYHEIMVHVPLFAHPSPSKVLVIGGGDGGAVREVAKHPEVKEIHQCEIDQVHRVVELSKQFLPGLSAGYCSSKLTLHFEDGVKFMERHKEEFDVIITDSSDPIGPAEPLFEKPYFEKVSAALKPNGIMCSQGENVFLHADLIRSSLDCLNTIFPVTGYCYTSVPTYPNGQIGFFIGSKNKSSILSEPVRNLTDDLSKTMGLKYYNSDIHRASFILPQFAKQAMSLNQTS